MKKIFAGILCLAVCAGFALTGCSDKKDDKTDGAESTAKKEVTIDLTDDYEEETPVYEYHFSGDEATLIGFHPEMSDEPITEIILDEHPVRMKTETVEEPAVVDGQNVIIKKKVQVPNDKEYTLTAIDDGVFMYASDAERIVIPDTVEEIGEAVFLGCENLREIVLPEGLEEIGDLTFYGCSSLETLNIPETVSSIGLFAFGDYFNRAPWYDNQKDSAVIVGDGILLKYNGSANASFGDEVKSIAYYAFTDSAAERVSFGEALESVDASAFYRSNATVVLPSDSKLVNTLKLNNVKVQTVDAGEADAETENEAEAETEAEAEVQE